MVSELKRNNLEFEIKTYNFDINNEVCSYVIIFEKGSSDVHIFSDYFLDKVGEFCLLNHSLNSRVNFYAYPLLKFLNYIFNERDNPIRNINDLKIDIVKEFLNFYSQGGLPNDNINRWRNATTVDRANYAISHFVYWLYYKKNDDKTKKLFKLKYIKSSDFTFVEKTTRSKNGFQYYKVKKLNNIVVPQLSKNVSKRKKVTRANLYSILKLIELSETQDPMLTFGLVLGAFMGLRVGDICQLNRGRLIGFENNYAGMFIDLTTNLALRSDGTITSSIKTKRTLPVHEAFVNIIQDYYNRHMGFLIDSKLNSNIYGALFLNHNGKAMTYKTYLNRFNELYKLLYLNILKEAENGNKKAIIEKEIIEEGRFTPHSLRFFFTQFIEETENGNPFSIKQYRADVNINSQNTYKKGTTNEQIRLIQEMIYKEIKEIKGEH